MSVLDERIELIENICDNKISKRQVEAKIDEMERRYQEDAFTTFNFQKKEKPWDKEYYSELRKLFMSGASSKEFILHLIDVRDDINKSEKKKLISVVITIIIVILIIVFLISE